MAGKYWIKLYSDRWLEGSIRLQPPVIRAVFIDLLCLATRFEGVIQVASGVAYTIEQLASLSGIRVADMRRALQELEKTGRIRRKNGIIYIKNWSKYQAVATEGSKETGVVFDKATGKLIVDNEVKRLFMDRLELTEGEFEMLKKEAEDYLVSTGRKYKDYRRFLWNNMKMLKWKVLKMRRKQGMQGSKFTEGVEI